MNFFRSFLIQNVIILSLSVMNILIRISILFGPIWKLIESLKICACGIWARRNKFTNIG